MMYLGTVLWGLGGAVCGALVGAILVRLVPLSAGAKAGNVTVSASPGDTATVTFTPNAVP